MKTGDFGPRVDRKTNGPEEKIQKLTQLPLRIQSTVKGTAQIHKPESRKVLYVLKPDVRR